MVCAKIATPNTLSGFKRCPAQARHQLGFWRCQGTLDGAVDRLLGGLGQRP
jgi:hypothetical protein